MCPSRFPTKKLPRMRKFLGMPCIAGVCGYTSYLKVLMKLAPNRLLNLGASLYGPARCKKFYRELDQPSAEALKQTATRASSPLLLYFAGHGTEDGNDASNTVCFQTVDVMSSRTVRAGVTHRDA